ncbi:hypothetical protein FJZ17_01515 [Candidatus Pacearchaeota archaeon]|nr:hypothetical protein [Candidatus Pacearchaeota archaeon]
MSNPENQNQKLADYVKKNISKGYTLDALRYSLLHQGYSRTSVEKAIEIANRQLAAQAPKMSEKPVIKYETIDDEEMAAKIAAQDKPSFWKRLFGRR